MICKQVIKCYKSFNTVLNLFLSLYQKLLTIEVFSCGKMPYGRLSNAQVVEQIREGHRLERPRSCPRDAYHLMKLCWEEQPEDRPSFNKLRTLLESLLCINDVIQ